MYVIPLTLGIITLVNLTASVEAAPPPQLLGKSVVVTWSESRIQRSENHPNFRPVSASHKLSPYIGSSGRVFSRQTNTTRSGSASTEQVQGQSGANTNSQTRVPTFSGRSMTVFAPFQQGGMRHLLIDFDGNWGSCTAKVSYAKQVGARTSIAWSPISKKMVEIQSITTSGETCSVQSGNVFGGQ